MWNLQPTLKDGKVTAHMARHLPKPTGEDAKRLRPNECERQRAFAGLPLAIHSLFGLLSLYVHASDNTYGFVGCTEY